MEDMKSLLVSSLSNLTDSKYLLNNQDNIKYIPYGTAGFRGKADEVEHLFLRVGLVAGMISWSQRANVGVMITASHNPVEDNGVKIIGSTGGMLSLEWERIVEEFCNFKAQSIEEVVGKLFSLVELQTLSGAGGDTTTTLVGVKSEPKSSNHGQAFIGCDTRPSSRRLVELTQKGLAAWKIIEYKFMGEITTPALHFIVGQATFEQNNSISSINYYDKLLNGFVALFDGEMQNDEAKQNYDRARLVIDCANGVGSRTMEYLFRGESSLLKKYLPAKLINIGDQKDDILNYECGADYVKTKHLPPRGANELNKRYASLDGDADRVVYSYLKRDFDDSLELVLLDGDKILALYTKYLTDTLRKYHLNESLTLGAIQTAYANGASTDYLKDKLNLSNVDCVDTGVKHLHKRALNYDFGIYFEANGHGTIWVSDKAKKIIEDRGIKELQQLLGILNNYTGDAISDILIVEMILNHYDWDVEQWDELYRDRPNSLIKIKVTDRSLVVTTNAGRTCLKPEGLQAEIDRIVAQFKPGSRSFVRASGTENVVRVYAECDSQEGADQLAQLIGEKVIEYCNK
uniref:Phosphoacetylglucosamine mutase n=1 Tax=Aceria tosichella TaxID=561515 RepID=A0A6G1S3H2_9ACAR